MNLEGRRGERPGETVRHRGTEKHKEREWL